MSVGEQGVDAADGRLRVFISSSPGELEEERQAVRSAVRTLRLAPVVREVGAGAHPLGQSDVFVGIYWQSYGWTAALSTLSGIEDEYLRSSELPQLVYVKEPAPARELALRRLLQRMNTEGQASRRTFSAPGELAELVIDDLAALVSERFYGGRTPTRTCPPARSRSCLPTWTGRHRSFAGSATAIRRFSTPSGRSSRSRSGRTAARSSTSRATGRSALSPQPRRRTCGGEHPARPSGSRVAGGRRGARADRRPHGRGAARPRRLRRARGAPCREDRRSGERRSDPHLEQHCGRARGGGRSTAGRSPISVRLR